MMVTENGYVNPHESNFESEESEKFEYSIPFYDCQYFGVIAHWMGYKLIFDKVELYNGKNEVIHKFDVDYVEDLIKPQFIEKMYNEAELEYSYLKK